MNDPAPILVVGAHRSGTSALTRVLEVLGVTMGWRRDPNEEAWFTLRLNEWLLRQCGGRWDHPAAVGDLIAQDDVRPLVVDYLRVALRSVRRVGFLGPGRALRCRDLAQWREAWGFKDPRTTFTLPLWLEVLPRARVVHLHRHGVDVAASLFRRQQAHRARSRERYLRHRPLLTWFHKRAGFGASPRCATLEGAFGLWEEYVGEARRHVAALGPRALEIAFEELATDPREVVGRLTAFCGVEPGARRMEEATRLLVADRAEAHVRDPGLRTFAERVGPRITALRE